jgi:aspartate racemase
MKTIGIIGGIGPQATMQYEELLHAAAQKYISVELINANSGYPPMIVYYLREAPIKRTPDGKPIFPYTPSESMIKAAKLLGQYCDFILIASNSPHAMAPEIENISGKPVLNMVEAVVNEIKNRKLKKIGIMGIGGSLQNNLYGKPLSREGIEAVMISSEISEKLDKSIFKVMAGMNKSEDKSPAEEGLQSLRQMGCDGIIMGCTEIPFLLADHQGENDLINPLEIMADVAIKYAIQ